MVPAPFADSPVLWAYNGFAGVLSSDISLTALALPPTIFGGLVAFGNAHIKSSLLAHKVHIYDASRDTKQLPPLNTNTTSI